MQLLFFLGYTILAALHHVACFLLVGVGGNISGKQSQIGPRKVTASTVLHAKENLLFGRCCEKIFDASLRRRLTNRV
ncbi:hypothetical protein V8G57_24270 [Collimonas sp. H4R21]|jgi:hypothetical protein|uniref:Secreted protein n=1 Tax=Collimonas rhizosphaerae TaxID=3126357 RepID=A0ABU9Q2T6_9BURK